MTVVPEGTYVTVPIGPNRGLFDGPGQIIETGDVFGGMQHMEKLGYGHRLEGAITYLPGAEMPNYILVAPDAYPQNIVNPLPGSMVVEQPTSLSELLRPNMGCVNWAACTDVNPTTSSNAGKGGYKP